VEARAGGVHTFLAKRNTQAHPFFTMHLPDGFLDTPTALLSTGAAVAGVALALKQVRGMEPRKVPMLGLGAAFVFAAQMLNFPVVGGTSGHIMGGVLAAILLGPGAAVVVLTCVLIVQCLMFADGGVTALGANIFNMAIVGACGGYLIFRLVHRFMPGDKRRTAVFAAAFAGWCGTVLASISCAGQLAWSGTAPWSIGFPAMANIHMLIGVGEGLATGLVVLAVLKTRPDLVTGIEVAPNPVAVRGLAVLIIIGMAVFVAPFASPLPDGLEAVASRLGFENLARSGAAAPMADYQLPIFGSPIMATALAGLVGTVLAFVSAYGLARVLVPGDSKSTKGACAEG
jgi:cobalt/nickel transport system permease protein